MVFTLSWQSGCRAIRPKTRSSEDASFRASPRRREAPKTRASELHPEDAKLRRRELQSFTPKTRSSEDASFRASPRRREAPKTRASELHPEDAKLRWQRGLYLCQLPLLLLFSSFSSLPSAGPQPRPSTPSVRCRTSTTTSHAQCLLPDLNHDQPRPVFAPGPRHAQCSLPDLNHDHPRPVFAAGPQPRPATPSVRCRTSTTTINDQCSLPDLNSYAKSYAK